MSKESYREKHVPAYALKRQGHVVSEKSFVASVPLAEVSGRIYEEYRDGHRPRVPFYGDKS